jgi:hypothetical protein
MGDAVRGAARQQAAPLVDEVAEPFTLRGGHFWPLDTYGTIGLSRFRLHGGSRWKPPSGSDVRPFYRLVEVKNGKARAIRTAELNAAWTQREVRAAADRRARRALRKVAATQEP